MYRLPNLSIAALLTRSGIPFLNSNPMDEPRITVITFTMTPIILFIHPFD